MNKKLVGAVGALALVVALGVSAVVGVGAQTAVPAVPTAAAVAGSLGIDGGFGFFGGSMAVFDAQANAVGLTPTQLFEQLHSGKTLSEVAQAQGVDLAKVQDAVKTVQTQTMKDNLSQAVKDGTMTQAQADWMLQGLEKGYLNHGGGFGPMGGRGGHGMMGGPRPQGSGAPAAPAAPTTPDASTQS